MLSRQLYWNWDLLCVVAGVVAIVGPIILVGWFFKEAKKKIEKLENNSSS
jgi:hypothetical protein